MPTYQDLAFRKMLRFAWQNSLFYQDYYESHGIREQHLAEIAVTDLPLVTKQILQEHFDQAVTDSRLRRADLEQWIQDVRDPGQLYKNDFVVVHSSGSSGNLAIFAYDRIGWGLANMTVATRLPVPQKGNCPRFRIATYVASHGHFAAVTSAALLSKSSFDVRIISLLSAMEQTLEELNAFQPHRLAGYSSSIAMLAEEAIRGHLQIHPQTIFVGGDMLSPHMKSKIQHAWGDCIFEVYACSESIYIGIREPGQDEMAIMDELNVLEALDSADHPVLPSEVGRVVLTNLYNRALPVLRYELSDYVASGKCQSGAQIKSIQSIQGRVSDALPVVLKMGSRDTIHPIILAEFYAQGIEKFQFISIRPDHLRICYVANRNIDDLVRKEFQRILEMKGAQPTTFEVTRVENIPNDPQTGKFRLVVIEDPVVV